MISKKRGAWNFGNNVPKNFENHINNSIPQYLEGHQMIIALSDYFLKDDSYCYDIGCSTGNLLEKLSKFTNKKCKFIGIDNEKKMIKFAKKRFVNNKYIKTYYADVIKYPIKKSDLIISYYTLQFIYPKFRQKIINKIYNSLEWGGAFIVFEKVRAPDARFHDILNSIYYDFKENNNFSSKEILDKQKSLRGVMEPFSSEGNLGLFRRAGFKDIVSIFKNICFEGFLCIK